MRGNNDVVMEGVGRGIFCSRLARGGIYGRGDGDWVRPCVGRFFFFDLAVGLQGDNSSFLYISIGI